MKTARVPFWGHCLLLAAVLLACLPIIGTNGLFSADEGAAIAQARQLSSGQGWTRPVPFPKVDATGRFFPLGNSEAGTRGFAPYGKHPLYPVLLAGADQVAGLAGMFLLSMVGTLLTAIGTALLARRLAASAAVPVLWFVGVGSPLFFDSFVIMAHTLAAACAVGAIAATIRALERRGVAAFGWWVVAAVALAGGILLRTEMEIFAVAIALTLFGLAFLRRSVLPAAGSVVVLVVTAAAHFGEARWARSIIGNAVTVSLPADSLSGSGIDGRLRGFANTWLSAEFAGVRTRGLLLIVMATAVVVGAVLLRFHRDEGLVRLLAIIAMVAAIAALIVNPSGVVPGLVIAFPMGIAGWVLITRMDLQHPLVGPAFAVWVLFALGVLATQYEVGGSAEFGGRYFAVGVPLLALLAYAGWSRRRSQLVPATRSLIVMTIFVTCGSLALAAVLVLRNAHEGSADLVATAARVVAKTTPGDGGSPVVVATRGNITRFAWSLQDDERWLLAPGKHEVATVTKRLANAGVDEFVLVSADPKRDLAALSDGWHAERVAETLRWPFYVVRR